MLDTAHPVAEHRRPFYRIFLHSFQYSLQFIFKSGDPVKRASAIVQAVTNYNDVKLIAELSSGLGEAMVGINESEIKLIMEERGK